VGFCEGFFGVDELAGDVHRAARTEYLLRCEGKGPAPFTCDDCASEILMPGLTLNGAGLDHRTNPKRNAALSCFCLVP